MRSRVTVGNGAEAEMVAMLVEQGRIALASKLGFMMLPPPPPSALDIAPDSSIVAAAVVVEAIVMAAGGSGWLWLPSYVVIRIDLSSAQRCTYIYLYISK